MENITMLGTGSAMVTKCYNTCFTISKDNSHFLVDTGGGNAILTNLEKANISVNQINHVFISHSHNDHIMGIIWIIRAVAQQILDGKYLDTLFIYCHKEVADIIITMCSLVLQKKFTQFIGSRIVFQNIEDGESTTLLNWNITFFDIKSSKHLQFGFKLSLESGRKLSFLGDEPYRDSIKEYVQHVDYLMHESFCLYSQRQIFKPYEKFHATVKDACENAEKLNIKNLLLFHTVDKDLENRKSSFIEEGKQYFSGNILVPDDLEVIELI